MEPASPLLQPLPCMTRTAAPTPPPEMTATGSWKLLPAPTMAAACRTCRDKGAVFPPSVSSSEEDLNLLGYSNSVDSWENIRAGAVKEGDWEVPSKIAVFPVLYRWGGAGSRWESLAYAEVKEPCKASKDYGRNSPFFNNLIRATFTAHVLTLNDLKHIMTVLFSPTEYTSWKGGWKRL